MKLEDTPGLENRLMVIQECNAIVRRVRQLKNTPGVAFAGNRVDMFGHRYARRMACITICDPSSTIRFEGILKKAVRLLALRNMAANSNTRQ